MNVYEVRVDGVTKKVTADHYDHDYNCGCVGLRFYRVINDPNSEDKAKLVAEFTNYEYVTLESESNFPAELANFSTDASFNPYVSALTMRPWVVGLPL
jgi:hypothetical protein